MKKLALLLLSLVGMSTVPAVAQSSMIDNPANKPYLGIRVGIDISSTAGQVSNIYNNSVGFTIGAVYNIPVWKNLYFEPGMSIFYDTFGETFSDVDLRRNLPTEVQGSIRNIGFRVPLNFGYRFDFTDYMSISLFTGPVVNLNATGKRYMQDEHYNAQLMGHGFKRFDMQWDFGASMQFYHNYYISVSGAVGVTKIYNTTTALGQEHFRRNTVNLSFGYNF